MHELRALKSWAVAGPEKAPYSLIDQKLIRIGIDNKDAFLSYEDACRLKEKHNMLGVGFILTNDDPYCCIDLDVKDSTTTDKSGAPHPKHDWVTVGDVTRFNKILERFRSYIEISLSGKGCHIWLKGSVPKGARRAGIEIYSDKRFIICTGKGIRTGRYKYDERSEAVILQKYPGTPNKIVELKSLLEELYGEVSATAKINIEAEEHEDGEELYSDHLLVERAIHAENAEKFELLCNGRWRELGYPSQSEADAALMSMFAFYSPSNEQCKRLFRMSVLGTREKAVKNDTYLNRTLKIVRNLNFDQKRIMETVIEVAPVEDPETLSTKNIDFDKTLTFPPGFAGEIAKYMYNSSLRPVKEIAVAGSIGLLAGLCGKAFPINNESGTNLYITLVARSGIGKESMYSAINRIVQETQKTCPVVTKYISSDDYASGQALIKAVNEEPCFLHMSSEWGRQLRRMSQDMTVDGPMQRLRTVMTSLHSKSGPMNIAGGLRYSNRDKNTASTSGVAYSMIGETTPGVYYDGLESTMMEDGFLSRFIVIEYMGDRVPTNKQRIETPSKEIVEFVAKLATRSTNLITSQTYQHITFDPIAEQMQEEFDGFCDDKINRAGDDESFRQMWNRAHLHSIRIAGLLAIADNVVNPIVEKEHFDWGRLLVMRHIGMMLRKFTEGNVGTTDDTRMSKLIDITQKYLQEEPAHYFHINPKMYEDKVVPRKYFYAKVRALSSFNRHRMGLGAALNYAIKDLVDNGYLTEVQKHGEAGTLLRYGSTEKCYKINMVI